MKKAFPYILLGLLAVVALVIKRCRMASAEKKTVTGSVDRNNGLDRRIDVLEYTTHATCRMECGHITAPTVVAILQKGQVNGSKSEVNARPCPVYALEGYSSDSSQHLRVIFAQCDYKTKVVTCIDLEKPFDCHCAGVGAKYEH